MTVDELRTALTGLVGADLARDLVRDFLAIRHDVLTATLERSNAGKLVESYVQALQYIERSGSFDEKPNVDGYLDGLDQRVTAHDEGLRFSAARIARAMYTLRNKRNIAHKGAVDPNQYDLRFLLHGAQWLLSELLRNARAISMTEAGRLVELVQSPVGGLVEDRAGRSLVLRELTAGDEILVLLQHAHPDGLHVSQLIASMDRRPEKTVRNTVVSMWRKRLVDLQEAGRYVLTGNGVKKAAAVFSQLAAETATGQKRTRGRARS